MNSRHLMAALILLLVGMSCFLSTPVLSGEHPWDVDRTGGGGSSPAPGQDSTRVGTDGVTAGVDRNLTNPGIFSWYGMIGRMTMYFYSNHQPATLSKGFDSKGKAER